MKKDREVRDDSVETQLVRDSVRGRSVGFSLFDGLKELGFYLTEGKNLFRGGWGEIRGHQHFRDAPKLQGKLQC